MATLVVAAIILSEQGILIAQRAKGQHQEGLWEFPGGKVELGETEEASLKREIQEELGYDIAVKSLFATNLHEYPGRTILLKAFICRLQGGEMLLSVHDAVSWVSRKDLPHFNFAPADIPIVDKLLSAAFPLLSE